MKRQFLAALVVGAVVISACTGGASPAPTGTSPAGTDGPAATAAEPYSIAFFAASSQNGFNAAVYEGVEKAGQALGIKTTIFDGEFNAQLQLNQVEDATASGQFDGFVIVANDTVGIATAIEAANAAGISTVTVLFPLGPDLAEMEPQVEGVVATVGRPPADGARLQADPVIEFCEDKDPCNVVTFIGQLIYPFDKLRYDTYVELFAAHDNIKVILAEGNYDRDLSLTVMTDVIQANREVHAIVSTGDQHIFGAEIALTDAGLNPDDVFFVGAGATQEAIAKIRSGAWDATLADYPVTMGERALQTIVDYLDDKTISSVVNEDDFYEFGPLVTTEILADQPEFLGEWAG